MKPPVRVIGAVAVLAVAAVVVTWLLRDRGAATPIVASGTVEITEADLGFQRPGRVDSIAVHEGDRVAAGAALAWLDSDELTAERHAAASQQASAAARLAELEAGSRSEDIAQAREALRAATDRESNASREAARAERLFEGGAISERQRDAAATALELAQADRAAAAERLQLVEAGPRTEQIAAQRALVAQAAATVARVDAALDQTTVRAPFAGRITIRHREPGETVAAGAPILSLTDPKDRWVRIYVRGDEVGRLALGQTATITADAFPDRTYAGVVTFISDEAEFTPRSVQTTEERVKLVYRVKVRITGDEAFDLKPGLPADVRLDEPRG
jgi:HlyD family secretion protein